MIQRLLEHEIRRQERRYGAPLDHLRDVARHAPGLAAKLGLLAPLASHRRALPLEALHAARLCATALEDCGACVRMAACDALRAGVGPELVRAIAAGRLAALPDELAELCRFVRAVHAGGSEQHELRERMRLRYGAAGLIELALAIALSSFFPRFKRALGHARSCAADPLAL